MRRTPPQKQSSARVIEEENEEIPSPSVFTPGNAQKAPVKERKCIYIYMTTQFNSLIQITIESAATKQVLSSGSRQDKSIVIKERETGNRSPKMSPMGTPGPSPGAVTTPGVKVTVR